MPYHVNRSEFLARLECVQPGLSPRDIVEQSSCLVFRGGAVWTYNDEVACRATSGLPKDFEGAVQAKQLLDVLRKLGEDDVELHLGEKELIVVGKGRRAGVRMDEEILLPLDKLERPQKEMWRELPENFTDAVGMVAECAGKDESQFAMTCVHFHGKWIEACDNSQLTRYRIKTGIEKPFLVRRDSLKHITTLGMTRISETDAWVHFRNGNGLTLSCRRYIESYPDLNPLLTVEAPEQINLPKGLVEAAQKAEIFSAENPDSNNVIIEIKPGKLRIKGVGVFGWYSEVKKINYNAAPIAFLIGPKLLATICKKHNECAIGNGRLMVDGGKWKYVTCLGTPAKIEEQAKAEAMETSAAKDFDQ